MLQVYLVRHGETQWNAERRIQGQSDSPLTAKGEQQAMQVGERARSLGITHIISSDLGRTKRTAEIIAQACGCDITFDSRLRELDMGVLEKRQIDSLTEEEEGWRRQLVNGTQDGRIPGGESMQELSDAFMPRWRPVWSYRRAADLYWSVTVSRWAVWSVLYWDYPPGRNAGYVCATALFPASITRKVSGWRLGGW